MTATPDRAAPTPGLFPVDTARTTPAAPSPSQEAAGPRPWPELSDADLYDLVVTVYGTPGPQGSKNAFRHNKTGKVITQESSPLVKPWREAVKTAALDAMHARPLRLDGPLALAVVFTVADQPAGKPTWWPTGEPWSKRYRVPPAVPPDLSKLIRSTEDALTDAGAIRDDGRIVQIWTRAHYTDPHARTDGVLAAPGAVIRVWRLPLTCGERNA